MAVAILIILILVVIVPLIITVVSVTLAIVVVVGIFICTIVVAGGPGSRVLVIPGYATVNSCGLESGNRVLFRIADHICTGLVYKWQGDAYGA